jgi:hypothetical protein
MWEGKLNMRTQLQGYFGLMLWTECKIVQFPISPNTHTNESQTAQTCLDQYSSQNGFCICGLKIFEKVAAQIEKYPVQIKMGGLHRGVSPVVETQGLPWAWRARSHNLHLGNSLFC